MQFTIRSHQGLYFEGEVRLIQVPATTGSLEIMDKHEAMLVVLEKGRLRFVDKAGKEHTCQLKGGILSTQHSHTVLLTEAILDDT